MSPRLLTIVDVAERGLCSGCGTCASLAPDLLEMVDDVEAGRRPLLRPGADAARTAPVVAACPGAALSAPEPLAQALPELLAGWGNVLGLWEGHAGDPAVRFAGSSGGAATALAVHALDSGACTGVLHTAARDDVPYLNRTVLSRTPAEVVRHTGSRYAPASPCDSLELVEQALGPCVVIGKPCDLAGLELARRSRPRLDANVALTIAVFCAGTPSTRGTLQMLSAMGFERPDDVASVRYRGEGWPGSAVATAAGPRGPERAELDYDASWNRILQSHRQWRCHVCPDHTGEFADIAVGDPWHSPPDPGDPGRSLVLARTPRGLAAVRAALDAGALVLAPAEPAVLPASQPNLLRTRGAVAARVATLRLLGMPAPRYSGFSLWRFWWSALPWRDKLRSTLGTARRARTRRLRTRRPVRPSSTGSTS